jgi:hypothetical protein
VKGEIALATLGAVVVVVFFAGLSRLRKQTDLAPPGAAAPRSPASPGSSMVAPALLQLAAQLDAAFQARSKVSDGTLPSAAHHVVNPTSDHERGDAFDVTHDPVNGPNLDELATALLADSRVTYVIYNRRIANRKIDSGAWRPYVATAIQTDPHTSHLHVSIDHVQRDSIAPWDLSVVTKGEAVS